MSIQHVALADRLVSGCSTHTAVPVVSLPSQSHKTADPKSSSNSIETLLTNKRLQLRHRLRKRRFQPPRLREFHLESLPTQTQRARVLLLRARTIRCPPPRRLRRTLRAPRPGRRLVTNRNVSYPRWRRIRPYGRHCSRCVYEHGY
jgi:hypothetical protein